MIDITNEKLIPLGKVPNQLPKQSNGKKIHISTVYRWVKRGLRGVYLETATIGGTTYTSIEALQRFSDRLSKSEHSPTENKTLTKSRHKQINQAAQQVKKLMEPKT